MAAEWKLVVFPLLISLASMIPFNSGKGFRLSPQISNGRQPKQIFPMGLLATHQMHNPYYHPYTLYNRNYASPQSKTIGPFFGYFPNLFAPPVTEPVTTTTTTTAAPPIPISCTINSGASDPSCTPCPANSPYGGTIQSKNYPNDYGKSAGLTDFCVYNFEFPAEHQMKITISAGSNIDYSDSNSTPNEFLRFYGDDTGLFEGPTVFPLSAAQSYTSKKNAKTASLSFFYNNVPCSSSPCKWEITYSVV